MNLPLSPMLSPFEAAPNDCGLFTHAAHVLDCLHYTGSVGHRSVGHRSREALVPWGTGPVGAPVRGPPVPWGIGPVGHRSRGDSGDFALAEVRDGQLRCPICRRHEDDTGQQTDSYTVSQKNRALSVCRVQRTIAPSYLADDLCRPTDVE